MAAPRTKRLRALIAALLLGAACKRASVDAPSETPELAAPEPSFHLKRGAAELGIQRIDKNIEDDESGAESGGAPPPPKAKRKQRVAELKRMRLEITRLRRGIEGAGEKSVAISGSTVAVIPWDKARGAELPGSQ